MLTRTRIALAAVLVAVTASAASAQGFDPNMTNRYPGYAGGVAAPTFQSAPVQLRQGRDAALNNSQFAPQYNRRVPGNQGDTSYGQDWAQSYGGGW